MQIQLNRYVSAEKQLTAAGLPEGADALVFCKAIKQRGGRGVFIARDETRAASFVAACRYFAPEIMVLNIPAWDCLPYDRISPGRAIAARRAAALFTLATLDPKTPMIVVTTGSAAMQKVPARGILGRAGFQAVAGQSVPREKLQAYLTHNGYSRASTVMEAGDYAIRGGIVDIFPPALSDPIRLDFFGDELESIRSFDVHTQRTTDKLPYVQLAPVSEVFISTDTIALFRKNYVAAFGGGISRDPTYAAVSDGIRTQGLEHYLPLFHKQIETLFDYIGPSALYAFDGLLGEARSERWDVIEDFYSSRKEHADARDTGAGDPSKTAGLYRPLEPTRLYLDDEEWAEVIAPLCVRDHSVFRPADAENLIDFGGRVARSFSNERRTEGANVFEAVKDHVRNLRNKKQKVLIAAWSEGSLDRLGNVFEDHNFTIPKLDRGPDIFAKDVGTAWRTVLPVEQGFEIDGLTIVSEQDILGDRLVNRGRKRKAKNFISDAAAMQAAIKRNLGCVYRPRKWSSYGPFDLWGCRVWQNRSGPESGFRRCHEWSPSCHRCTDDNFITSALQNILRPFQGLACSRAPAI